jgi:cell division protein FtsQ
VGERRWDVVLDRDQRILLPETEPGRALERVLALDQAQDLLDRDVTVDLRLEPPPDPSPDACPWRNCAGSKAPFPGAN